MLRNFIFVLQSIVPQVSFIDLNQVYFKINVPNLVFLLPVVPMTLQGLCTDVRSVRLSP